MTEPLGVCIARFADASEARMLAVNPNARLRCRDCAFRLGTEPNQDENTVLAALGCVADNRPFLCHLDPAGAPLPDDVAPSVACAGWVHAIRDKNNGDGDPDNEEES